LLRLNEESEHCKGEIFRDYTSETGL
jgi:hypothetical protein